MEIWKDIDGFENYQVSTWGRVRNKDKILKPYVTEKGYLKINLYKNGTCSKNRVNRLVAQAFIPNPDNLPQVDHLDGNKWNNSISNLRWVNNATNRLHAEYLKQMAITVTKKRFQETGEKE